MTKGTYGGFTYGAPGLLGLGGGVYVDSYGNIYPQAYWGSPKLGVSSGYSDDLENFFDRPVRVAHDGKWRHRPQSRHQRRRLRQGLRHQGLRCDLWNRPV